MKRKWSSDNLFKVFAVPLITAGLALGLSGCSEGKERVEGSWMTNPPPNSIQGCLETAGARRAHTARDLDFLLDAEANEEVTKPGFAYDKATDAFVMVWQGITDNVDRPAWRIWFGQPFGDTQEPMEIAKDRSEKTFILYVNEPNVELWKRVNKCLELKKAQNVKPALHSVTGSGNP